MKGNDISRRNYLFICVSNVIVCCLISALFVGALPLPKVNVNWGYPHKMLSAITSNKMSWKKCYVALEMRNKDGNSLS